MSGARGPGSIMLVEDDPLSRKLMKDFLEAHAYAVSAVNNGADALELARQIDLDLIIMDVGLPGMDGLEVTRRLQGDPRLRDVPVVAVTAYAMPGDEERMLAAGAKAYLTKPLRFSELLSVVSGLISPSRQREEAPSRGSEK